MKRILVVDDSTTILKHIEGILGAEYRLTLVKSGQLALAYLQENPVDMVLLDVFMPEMDGFETFEKIKELKKNWDVPVIFFTSGVDAEMEIQALSMGAKDFIRKPFVPEVMKNRIANILELDVLNKELEKVVAKKTRQVEDLSFEIISTIADMIEARDRYNKGHSVRVAEYSALLAQSLGWSEDRIRNLKYIALLHDIGKVGASDRILNKPGKLTEAEYNMVKAHTTIGGDLLKDMESISAVDSGAKYHHERYDGKGYPTGMSGENIPTVARIIGIADAYDAMSSKRVFRDALSAEDIRAELINGRGTQFDPKFLDEFLKLFDEGKLVLTKETKTQKTISGESSQLLQQIMISIEEEAKRTGEMDYLTGLPGRQGGETQISKKMKQTSGCLAFIDLDNLKQTNDTMGHIAGDRALTELGEVLADCGPDDIAMRIGGDEFVLFMAGANREAAIHRIEDICDRFEQRKEKNPYLSISSISAGLCLTNPSDTYADVLARADKALYHVKQRGKSGYYFYTNIINTKKNKANDLGRLIDSLKNQTSRSGSINVGYREFTKIYDYVRCLTNRFRYNMELVLITLQPAVADSLYIDEKEQAMLSMEKTIQASLCAGDVCTRFSSEQFLLILMDAEPEDVEGIVRRIFENFRALYDGKELILDYDVAELPKE